MFIVSAFSSSFTTLDFWFYRFKLARVPKTAFMFVSCKFFPARPCFKRQFVFSLDWHMTAYQQDSFYQMHLLFCFHNLNSQHLRNQLFRGNFARLFLNFRITSKHKSASSPFWIILQGEMQYTVLENENKTIQLIFIGFGLTRKPTSSAAQVLSGWSTAISPTPRFYNFFCTRSKPD